MASKNPVIAHRHLAVIWCDSAASLAEILTQIDLSEVPHQRYGDRAIALPVPYVQQIHETLRSDGTYPRVIGDVWRPVVAEATEESEES